MTVFCVNSGVTYADIAAADAAESGINYGVPTIFEQSGLSSAAVVFSNSDYASSFIYTAAPGEETTGDISVGAQCTGTITCSTANAVISNLRTRVISMGFPSANNMILERLVVDGNGGDPILFEDAGTTSQTFDNVLVYNCSDGWRATATNDNAIATNCTVVDATGFGFLRPRCVNTVALNTGGASYLQEGGSSSNYWADDGNGDQAITEPTTTDIFVDYVGGDYRVDPTSSAGAAGAGAFIASVPSGLVATITESISSFSESSSVNVSANIELSVTELLSSPSDSSSVVVTPNAVITVQVTEVLNAPSDSSSVNITEAGNVSATVTELLSGFSDDSAVEMSSNIEAVTTELLNSFSDDSVGIIQKELQASVTEILNSFEEYSSLSLPVKVNTKKLIKVIGNSRRVSVRSNSRTIKVR